MRVVAVLRTKLWKYNWRSSFCVLFEGLRLSVLHVDAHSLLGSKLTESLMMEFVFCRFRLILFVLLFRVAKLQQTG
jgi:hypothetical protein